MDNHFFKNELYVVVIISFSLLFAMGLKNALVTNVFHSVARTPHLKGLFTDLGIEFAQLFYYREKDEKVKLKRNVFLKLMIIGSFFIGGIIGGFIYRSFQLKKLLLSGSMQYLLCCMTASYLFFVI